MKEILTVPRESTEKAIMAAALAKFLEENRAKPASATVSQYVSNWKVQGRREGMRK
jgi:hypothetical protein